MELELDGGDLGCLMVDVSADWCDEPQAKGYWRFKVTTFLGGQEIDITSDLKQSAIDYITEQLDEERERPRGEYEPETMSGLWQDAND